MSTNISYPVDFGKNPEYHSVYSALQNEYTSKIEELESEGLYDLGALRTEVQLLNKKLETKEYALDKEKVLEMQKEITERFKKIEDYHQEALSLDKQLGQAETYLNVPEFTPQQIQQLEKLSKQQKEEALKHQNVLKEKFASIKQWHLHTELLTKYFYETLQTVRPYIETLHKNVTKRFPPENQPSSYFWWPSFTIGLAQKKEEDPVVVPSSNVLSPTPPASPQKEKK
jgi:hypothetical protein